MRPMCSIYTMYDYTNTNPDGSPRQFWQCSTHNMRLNAEPAKHNYMTPSKCEHGAIEDIVDARFEALEARVKALEDKQK